MGRYPLPGMETTMKSFQEYSANSIFYRIGLILLIPLIVLCILRNTGNLQLTDFLYPCLFYRISGLCCPGCGGTRAVQALLKGDFISCFLYHPVVLYAATLYIIFMASHTWERIATFLSSRIRHQKQSQKKSSHQLPAVRGLNFHINYVYIGIIIIFLQWIVKMVLHISYNNY